MPEFRRRFFEWLSMGWTAFRTLLLDAPLKLRRLPMVQRIWRHRTFIRLRRYVLIPMVAAIIPVQIIPWILTGRRNRLGLGNRRFHIDEHCAEFASGTGYARVIAEGADKQHVA